MTTSESPAPPSPDQEGRSPAVIASMSVSADGFTTDRDGNFTWTVPGDAQFRVHLEHVSALGAYILGRRLYETMAAWDTDPSLRSDPLRETFADVWHALPKVVVTSTLTAVDGTARIATRSLADEVAALRAETDRDIAIGGPTLTAAAMALGLVDEFRIFRYPVLLGGGTPFFPPVAGPVPLELLETRRIDDRVVYERYGRVAPTT